MGGGKGGGGGTEVYDYNGSIAGAVCCGPVDGLVALIVDGKKVWPKTQGWNPAKSYSIYELVDLDGITYIALSAHTSSALNAPPNATFWSRYVVTRDGSANPYAFTVEDYGQAYFYWGTTNQTLDTTGEKLLNDNGHPPYRRQAVLVLKDFLFGRERVSAPNIEVIVRRHPKQTPIAGTAAFVADGQANPVGALLDLYTDPVYGAGLTLDAVGGPDSTTAVSTANALIADAAKTWISPILTQAKSLRQFTAELLAYYDGWVRFNRLGEIEFGKFNHNTAYPTFTKGNTIDFNDLIDEVSYSAEGFASTFNQTQVQFTDRERSFRDGSVTSVSGYNLAVTAEPRTAKIERPWITRRQQASDHAAEWGKINSEPKISGSLVVRAERAEQINPGDFFLLTHDDLSISIVCRCIGKDVAQPPAGRVTLRFQSDLGSAPIPFQPQASASSGTAFPDAESLTLHQFFQPPPSMVESIAQAVVVPLVARSNALTTGANVWVKQDDVTGFFYLDTISSFAVHGTLQQNYNPTITVATSSRSRTTNVATITTATAHGFAPGMIVGITGLSDTTFNGSQKILTTPTSTTFTYANTGSNVGTTTDTGGTVDPFGDDCTETMRVTLNNPTNASDLARMLETQTEDAINDSQICVVVFDTSNRKTFEIFTLRAMRIATGESFYRLKVRREQWGSAKRSAVTGDKVWIGYRADLIGLSMTNFSAAMLAGSEVKFRLQSFNAASVADLSDSSVCPDISYTFADPYAPTFTFDSVKADGVEVTNFATNYSTNTVWTIDGKIDDSSGDLTNGRLVAKLGTQETVLWQASFEPTSEYRFSVRFTLPVNGTWEIRAEGKDATQRFTTKQLTQGGTSTPAVFIDIRGNNDTASPTANPAGGSFSSSTIWPKSVTLTTTTAGAHIEYQIVTAGASAGATWTTISATSGTVLVDYNKRLYARAHLNGSNYSTVSYWDFYLSYSTNKRGQTIP